MPDFVFKANIAHFRELLADEADAGKIETLHKLLAEEEAKLTKWQAENLNPLGPERDAMLKRASQGEVASHLDEWANSAGLQPPK